MLINTVPDDCLLYIRFNYFIFNIVSIVNVFMLSTEKKNLIAITSPQSSPHISTYFLICPSTRLFWVLFTQHLLN